MTEPRDDREAAAFFVGRPEALAAYRKVRALVESIGPASVRTTRSQVAFRRRRGFAYLWLPGRWLAHPDADLVLSIALQREDRSPRFKEVAHPARRTWMHHLEIRALAEIDGEVADWLREAWTAAG